MPGSLACFSSQNSDLAISTPKKSLRAALWYFSEISSSMCNSRWKKSSWCWTLSGQVLRTKQKTPCWHYRKTLVCSSGHYISKGIWWSSKKAQGEAAEIVRRMEQLSWEGELKESCMEIWKQFTESQRQWIISINLLQFSLHELENTQTEKGSFYNR